MISWRTARLILSVLFLVGGIYVVKLAEVVEAPSLADAQKLIESFVPAEDASAANPTAVQWSVSPYPVVSITPNPTSIFAAN